MCVRELRQLTSYLLQCSFIVNDFWICMLLRLSCQHAHFVLYHRLKVVFDGDCDCAVCGLLSLLSLQIKIILPEKTVEKNSDLSFDL